MTKIDANPDVDDAAELYRRFVAQNKRALKYSEDQPRVPAGQPGGGEFGGGGGRERSEGFRTLSRDEIIERNAATLSQREARPGAGRVLAERVYEHNPSDMRLLPTGQHVEFDGKAKITDARKADTLAAVKSLTDKYPERGVSFNVLRTQVSTSMTGTPTFGFTRTRGATVMIDQATLKPAGMARFTTQAAGGFFMPYGMVVKPIDYVTAHEYGHTLDVPRGQPRDPVTQAILDDAGSRRYTSEYGRSSPVEMYAEHFAEWHCSGGSTDNPVTQRLAAAEGWR